jgi:translocation and assembly module TamB
LHQPLNGIYCLFNEFKPAFTIIKFSLGIYRREPVKRYKMEEQTPQPATTAGRKWIRVLFKVLLWIIGIPLALILLVVIALQFSQTQHFITAKACTYLSGKIKSKVSLAGVHIAFPKSVQLTDLYVEDRQKDTLVYIHNFEVDIDILALLSHQVIINNIEIDRSSIHLQRLLPDTSFNFAFIPQAFAAKAKTIPDTVQKKAPSKPWEISLHGLKLSEVNFGYHDSISGMQADIRVGTLLVAIDVFDLARQKIHVKEIKLAKSQVAIVQLHSYSKPAVKDSAKSAFDIGLRQLGLDSLHVSYLNPAAGQKLDTRIGTLNLLVNSSNLSGLQFDAESLSLINSDISFEQKQTQQADTLKKEKNGPAPSWLIKLHHLELAGNNLVYNNNAIPAKGAGMDFNHLGVSALGINGRDLLLKPSSMSMSLQELKLKEKSGLVLNHLAGQLTYDSTHIELRDLKLETNRSSIHRYLALYYRSPGEIADLSSLKVKVDLNSSRIAMDDILLFHPALLQETGLKGWKGQSIVLQTEIEGKINDLKITKLLLKAGDSTRVRIQGRVQGLPDLKKLFANLRLEEFHTGSRDIQRLAPDGSIPPTICLPGDIRLEGNFKGYLKNFNSSLALRTSLGNAQATISMDPDAGNQVHPFIAHMQVQGLEMGLLLNQQGTLGRFSMQADVQGTALDSTNCMDIQANIAEAGLKGYLYHNLHINGSLEKKTFTGTADMDDENLAFVFNGRINADPANPELKFKLNLKGVDLDSLHLASNGLRISALIESDMQGRAGKNLTGTLRIQDGLVVKNNIEYPVDTILLNSSYAGDKAKITFSSELLTALLEGEIHASELPASFQKHFSRYFSMKPGSSTLGGSEEKFNYDIHLVDASLLTDLFLPSLKNLEPSRISGSFDSRANKMDLYLDVPRIIYNSTLADSVHLRINSDPQQLKYSLRMAEVADTSIRIENIYLGGLVKDNTIAFQLNTLKDDSIKMLAVGGTLKSKPEGLELRIDPKLTLSNNAWDADAANYVLFRKQDISVHQFILSRAQESVSLNSTGESEEAPIEMDFKNFDLSELSKIAEKNKDLMRGVVNGKLVVKKEKGQKAFVSDVTIDKLRLMGAPVGNVTVHADNEGAAGRYNLKLNIKDSLNDLGLQGTYQTASTGNNLDLILDIRNLNLASVEPFAGGQVSSMSGGLNGKIAIRGTTAAPDLQGTLNLKKCALKPKIIDSYLKIESGQMSLASKRLNFNSFSLTDSLGHKAVLDGYVDIKDLKQPFFDIRLRTTNFLALNTNRKDNPLYYGTVYLDSDIHLKGTPDAPVARVKVKLNKGTSVTYLRPEAELKKLESIGIVEFNDSVIIRHNIMRRKEKVTLAKTTTKGLDLSASIEIDKGTRFKVIVDQETGDSLVVKGNAMLDFAIDPSGKTSLTGRYKVNDGSYHLAINEFIHKDFRIQPGSVITWSGDVSEAYLDLTAIYTVKTSPLDLVSGELAGMTEAQRNTYRTNLDFQVYLKMKGSLESPEISFDIQLPPDERGALNGAVDAKLSQMRGAETEMNKQVFSLIALNKFLAEDPLDNSSGGGGDPFSSTARSSASKLLSEQLSRASGKYVKGVDLNVGVESYDDYSSGQQQGRTQVQVGLKKQILNDRVSVQVGGNVDVEGEKAKQNNASEIAGNIVVDYKLTSDGRYKLKGFRKNEYENPLEGELTKTGIGLIFTKDFKRFRDLFRKNSGDDLIE